MGPEFQLVTVPPSNATTTFRNIAASWIHKHLMHPGTVNNTVDRNRLFVAFGVVFPNPNNLRNPMSTTTTEAAEEEDRN